MRIAIPKEITVGEKRVAATPETVKQLVKTGFEVVIQTGAGCAASYSDEDYTRAGAKVEFGSVYPAADTLLKVQKPSQAEVSEMKQGAVIFAFLQPYASPEMIQGFVSKKISSLSMEMIPRIARAQKLDALSSQSNIAGYKAVLLAANAIGKAFPMMITAAGTIQPARVLVLGAGVAGLQAIATAKRLGAVVEAFDTRPAVKEQVESLGGRFIEVAMAENETEDKGGYAKEISKESHEKELELIRKHAKNSDIVITTALIPNKPAPVLIPEQTVKEMKTGSVIVDLAVERGGNCPIAEPDREVVKHGVKIIGYTNLPSLIAAEASRLYARNVLHFVLELYKEGKIELSSENEVVAGSLLTHQGEVVHPGVKNHYQQGAR